MKKECAWCGKNMGKVEPFDNDSITHGICKECEERVLREDEEEENESRK